jgi:hypothetical protein
MADPVRFPHGGAAIEARTGRDWAEWCATLDEAGAAAWRDREAGRHRLADAEAVKARRVFWKARSNGSLERRERYRSVLGRATVHSPNRSGLTTASPVSRSR